MIDRLARMNDALVDEILDLRMVLGLSDQAALAIERVYLSEEMDRARVAAETEKLRARAAAAG